MALRKRGRDEIESSEPPTDTSLLNKIRNMWEFACVMQYIFTFGKLVKIDEEFDIEAFEMECLQSGPSTKLEEIGLTMLKWISSHRGLTLENWDEYTRRQYVAKAPHINPYGTDEQPGRFRDFDITQRIRILHQLTVWTFWNPDRMRERMPEQKETDQTLWRVEELGWDREERSYFVLDDSRLYRRTEPPLPRAPKAKMKSNSLKAQAARRRASKRRKLEGSETPEIKDQEGSVAGEPNDGDSKTTNGDHQVDTFGGFKWECIAITSEQYRDFLSTIQNSRDLNEKDLRRRIVEQVLPVVEKAEESHRRKLERKQKESLNMQRLSGAKRSSRLADKHERERQEREAMEAAGKHAAELAAAHREEERQSRMDQDRQSRMMTREQRIKDREYKRLLHEEQLAKVAEEAKRVEAGEARGSERHLKAQMEKHKRDLEDLSADEDWVFDCSGCGVYGKNIDDGAHSMACEKCNVWQHSKCLGIRQVEAEKEDFHFVCGDCKQKMENAKRPNIKIKFRAGLSASPPQVREQQTDGNLSPTMRLRAVEIPARMAQDMTPPNQGHHVSSDPFSPQKMSNGVVPSLYLQHAALRASNSHSAYRSGTSPQACRSSDLTLPNGNQEALATYPHPSNPPHQQSPISSLDTNGQIVNSLPASGEQFQNSRPASKHSSEQHPSLGASESQIVSQRPHPTSQTSPILNQTPNGVGATPSSQPQGHRLPSPVINRPTMSPTQGNPDVGPLAGVPQKSLGKTSMSSPPSQSHTHQSHSAFPPGTHTPRVAPHMNGLPHPYPSSPNAAMNHSNQPHRLSGLSPTKHATTLPPPTPHTSHNPSSLTPHHPQTATTTDSRRVSGTPVLPPSERLQPSATQLSKTPVPTPSKALTPASMGKTELRRVSEEIREGFERERDQRG